MKITAVQVIDERAALLSRVLDAKYVAYASGLLADQMMKQMRRPDIEVRYVERDLAAGWAESMPTILKMAEAYHVTDDMLELANWAGHMLPDDVALEHDMVPTDFGFLMFEKGMRLPEVWGRETYCHAIAWRVTNVATAHIDLRKRGYQAVNQEITGRGLEITTFVDIRDARDEVTRMILEKVPMESLLDIGHLQVSGVTALQFGDPQPPTENTPEWYEEQEKTAARHPEAVEMLTTVPYAENWLRTVIAIFELMNQTVTDVGHEDADRKTARRMHRMNLPTRVTVIRLRRSAGVRREGESLVEWQHRWVVRGHWRNQPIGPRVPGAERETKRIWIAPYVKGPEDKPFVVSDKVYDLAR